MKYERWLIPETDDAAVEALMDAGYPYLVSTVLASRGVVTPEQAAAHLDRERSLVYSPFLMRDMDKAVARIDRALAGGETIAVFGDYDVDGITSTCLLTDYLRSRGAAVLMHIPRRIEEGYGLGCDAIRALAEQGVTLIVTVDCGITGVEETAFAAALGVDLVITDHHECKDELPAACAVVDPHRPDCSFPFKHLAGVGVALELVLALGGAERENALFSRYCTLAAIGTIADVMRMEGENRTIVQCGLEGIDRSDFTGLHALLREAGLTGRPVSSPPRPSGSPASCATSTASARASSRISSAAPSSRWTPSPPPSATRSCSRARNGIRAWSASSPRVFPKNSPAPAS